MRGAEIELTSLLTTNNLPISLMDTLSGLCANVFHDSNIAKSLAIHRTKATAIMKNGLGETFKKKLSRKVGEPGHFFYYDGRDNRS